MDPITLALTVVVLVNSALGLILLFNSTERGVSRLYAFNIALIVTWAWSMLFYRQAGVDNVLVWTKVLYISASLIGSSFLYFSLVFPKNEHTVSTKTKLLIFEI